MVNVEYDNKKEIVYLPDKVRYCEIDTILNQLNDLIKEVKHNNRYLYKNAKVVKGKFKGYSGEIIECLNLNNQVEILYKLDIGINDYNPLYWIKESELEIIGE